jgi:hypothetical protein
MICLVIYVTTQFTPINNPVFSTFLNVTFPNAGQVNLSLARFCPCFMLTYLDAIFPNTPYFKYFNIELWRLMLDNFTYRLWTACPHFTY